MAAAESNQTETAGDACDGFSDNKTRVIVSSFIIESVQTEDPNVRLEPEDLGNIPANNNDQDIKQVVKQLIQIANELETNVELKRLIDNVPVDSTRDVLLKVYKGVFSDGFSLGKLAVILFFASKLVLKAAIQKCRQVISSIFSTTSSFIETHVLPFIRDQGGWESLPWQNVAAVAGVAASAAFAFLLS
ncbi:apoptosis regulator BAX-like [Protopterus annectens]|uniref:apoptosis regulator BAX-like n=1 Tax=Protopterus annectens TaxID=7888 RepID=UPI001CFB6E42|nr:apoptosis regulator BAX-like [Protopterus annectens]